MNCTLKVKNLKLVVRVEVVENLLLLIKQNNKWKILKKLLLKILKLKQKKQKKQKIQIQKLKKILILKKILTLKKINKIQKNSNLYFYKKYVDVSKLHFDDGYFIIDFY